MYRQIVKYITLQYKMLQETILYMAFIVDMTCIILTVQNVTGNNSIHGIHSGHDMYNPTVQNVTGNNSIHGIHSGHDMYNPNSTKCYREQFYTWHS
jgi:hypothetical protein